MKDNKLLESLLEINSDIDAQEKIRNESPFYMGQIKGDFPVPGPNILQIRMASFHALGKKDGEVLVKFMNDIWNKRQDEIIEKLEQRKDTLEKELVSKLQK